MHTAMAARPPGIMGTVPPAAAPGSSACQHNRLAPRAARRRAELDQGEQDVAHWLGCQELQGGWPALLREAEQRRPDLLRRCGRLAGLCAGSCRGLPCGRQQLPGALCWLPLRAPRC